MTGNSRARSRVRRSLELPVAIDLGLPGLTTMIGEKEALIWDL